PSSFDYAFGVNQEGRRMFLIVVSMLASDLCSFGPDARRIDRLIEQLASEYYAEREGATKALDRLGEPALDALRRAAASSHDAEIGRRGERLVNSIGPRVREEQARAIRRSHLSPEDKGRWLKVLVKASLARHPVDPPSPTFVHVAFERAEAAQ